jgi:hypothetical protein
MSNSLSAQIRALVESVDPVTSFEAITRAERGRAGPVDTLPTRIGAPTPDKSGFGQRRRLFLAVAASVVILVGAGLAWALGSPGPKSGGQRKAAHSERRSVILTGSEVHAIVAHSTAAATSGTALVTETSAENGAPQSSTTVHVTFDGANIDELITVQPEPAGSAATFTTDDRLVDGQFYIYTPGPNGLTQWLHDINSSGDLASMQFPDPRTLYSALSPSAQFQVIGSTRSGGTTLTKLQALDPTAIDSSSLASFADGAGSLRSLQITIGRDNVVEQMSFTTTQTLRVCKFTGTSQQLKTELQKDGVSIASGTPIRVSELEKKGVIAIANSDGGKFVKVLSESADHALATCGPSTWSNDVSVTFSNLGSAETVTAPQGAIDFQGKG